MMPYPIFSTVLIGEGSLLIQCAEHIRTAGHEIRTIISADRRIEDWANRHAVPYITPDTDLVEHLGKFPFDYLMSIVNLSILPPALLALPRQGAINFHDSLLPTYAGVHATSWALMHGEKTHGVTWHEMTGRVDAGRILKRRPIDIGSDETALSLNAKCYEAGAETFAELIHDLSLGTVTPVEARLEERSYFGKYERPESACLISWGSTAEEIRALVGALSFGPYDNPLGLPKILVGNDAVIAAEVEIIDIASPATPGTVTLVGDDAIHVATGSHDLVLRRLLTVEGQALSIADLVARSGLRVGYQFAAIDQDTAERLSTLHQTLARHEIFWVERLASLEPLDVPYANRSAPPSGPSSTPMETPVELAAIANDLGCTDSMADLVVAALAVYLGRLGDASKFDLGFTESTLRARVTGLDAVCAMQVPLSVTLQPRLRIGEALRAVLAQLHRVRQGMTFMRDVVARYSTLRRLLEYGGRPTFPIAVEIADDLDRCEPSVGSDLTLLVSTDGSSIRWIYDPAVLKAEHVDGMQQQFTQLLRAAMDSDAPLAGLPLLSARERLQVLVEWNATRTESPRTRCIHHAFEEQVDRTPDAVAVAFEGQQITYRELDARANQVARYLQALGVGPESLVGICLERSIDLIVALYGVHKAGGAYVPLDPTYPLDRLRFMIQDARLSLILTQEHLVDRLAQYDARVVRLDAEWPLIARGSVARVTSDAGPENLAYVIYTSGSTGKPKGVMVNHRNVINFFAGMDRRIAKDPAGVWLAVTSLSFDISVLELFWTLTRGFKVVLHADRERATGGAQLHRRAARRDVDFSLFYFASDEGEGVADKYQLLMEGAKFADRHGFSAVWTPERHFHAFGGLYPNPSVASAALAAVTERVKIRAGSVVLPLHSPIRVAEEWSLVDNLSKGRVGISFASGWQPDDFALAPQSFADRKDVMRRDIETVRKLWRGETVAFPGPTGDDVEVRTLPRPVQPELPVWLTAAGNPDTFRMAGEIGAGLLTHLLGQSIEELAKKIAIYRQSWRESGRTGSGHVTLMLHTFVGDNDDAVRETVRTPMKEYLRSSVDLIRKAAWSFPAFAVELQSGDHDRGDAFDSGILTDEEMDALLDHAFERYFRTSGLFGTPRTCLGMVERLKAIDVDEIACLIDFGVPSATTLQHLAQLDELRRLSCSTPGEEADYSIAGQIECHQVTHLQCTPSMASMLLTDERTCSAIRPLKNVLIGGEMFPAPLAKTLRGLVAGDVINMYGPTETTIWSSTYRVNGVANSIPVGRPIANTDLYILDSGLQPVPVGVPGELYIGGDGVVRGYLHRPELTGERFIRHPFSDAPDARLYRTGDVARYHSDGNVELIGRRDSQVKIRGHRIELGEIESLLQELPWVQEAAVVAREDAPGDIRLVGYVVVTRQTTVTTAELRDALKEQLPDFMVPSHIVVLDALPLTPNAKLDRRALPAPGQVQAGADRPCAAPRTDTERTLVEIWQSVLQTGAVGIHDNFFDIGGHSLLAMQLIARVRDAFGLKLPLRSLVEAPTVAELVVEIEGRQISEADADELARVLADLETLSDDEVLALLEQ